MKILLATEYFYPHWTGIAVAFKTLSEQLGKEGHQVTVLTTQFEKGLKNHEMMGNVSIFRASYLFRFSRSHYSPLTIIWALRLLRKNEALIINSPHSNILPLTVIGKVLGKGIFIFHQGDLLLPRQSGNWVINRIIERLFDMMTFPAMSLADKVSTYTADYAKHSRVMRFFMNKFIAYIPPISPSNKRAAADFTKKLTRLKKKYILIGFAGRFVEEKGFDILYKAMPLIVKAIPAVHFVFAGVKKMAYEPFYNQSQALFDSQKKNVTYLGLLSSNNLFHFYKNLDLFVISSRSDCFPLTQIEAALTGTPIVCTDIPGARVLVQETECGEIIPSENPTSLALGIITVIKKGHFYKLKQKNVINFLKTYEKFNIDN